MGAVVRDAFAALASDSYAPTYPAISLASPTMREVRLADLLDADLLPEGTALLASDDAETTATVAGGGDIVLNGKAYDSPSAAAAAASGASRNGWTCWTADLTDGRFTLSTLREALLNSGSVVDDTPS